MADRGLLGECLPTQDRAVRTVQTVNRSEIYCTIILIWEFLGKKQIIETEVDLCVDIDLGLSATVRAVLVPYEQYYCPDRGCKRPIAY